MGVKKERDKRWKIGPRAVSEQWIYFSSPFYTQSRRGRGAKDFLIMAQGANKCNPSLILRTPSKLGLWPNILLFLLEKQSI